MSLGCAAAAAHAESFFQLEAGLGATSATKDGDGMYYDEGKSHHTPVNSFGARAGIQLNVIDAPVRSWVPGLRAHLTYAYWGSLNWTATVAEDEGNVDNGALGGYSTQSKTCVNNFCGQMRQFNSSGNTQSINLTLEPYWNLGGGWTVGVEAGPAVYFGPWKSYYVAIDNGPFGPAGSVIPNSHRIVPHMGAVVGASVSKGPFSLRYEYLYAPTTYATVGGSIPSGIKGAHMLTLDYTF
jgi:hypothetical protein